MCMGTKRLIVVFGHVWLPEPWAAPEKEQNAPEKEHQAKYPLSTPAFVTEVRDEVATAEPPLYSEQSAMANKTKGRKPKAAAKGKSQPAVAETHEQAGPPSSQPPACEKKRKGRHNQPAADTQDAKPEPTAHQDQEQPATQHGDQEQLVETTQKRRKKAPKAKAKASAQATLPGQSSLQDQQELPADTVCDPPRPPPTVRPCLRRSKSLPMVASRLPTT